MSMVELPNPTDVERARQRRTSASTPTSPQPSSSGQLGTIGNADGGTTYFLIGPDGQGHIVSRTEFEHPPAGYTVPNADQHAWTTAYLRNQNPGYYGTSNTPSTPGTPTPDPSVDDSTDRSARATVEAALHDIGLDSELDWALGELLDGKSPAEVMLDLRRRDAYKERFILNEYRKQNGLNEWSPAEIIAYEQAFRQTMRSWGVPLELYDTTKEIAQYGGKDLSIPELNQRIEKGFAKVTANPDARAWFRDQYGADGDVALAMFFFDHERSLPLLERQAGAGTLGGTARRYGVNLDRQRAERLIQNGVNVDLAPSAFAQLGRIDPLFRESVSEKQDLTAEETGVDYVFGQSATAEAILGKRLEERQAAVSGGGGAALGRERTGTGTAR